MQPEQIMKFCTDWHYSEFKHTFKDFTRLEIHIPTLIDNILTFTSRKQNISFCFQVFFVMSFSNHISFLTSCFTHLFIVARDSLRIFTLYVADHQLSYPILVEIYCHSSSSHVFFLCLTSLSCLV